MATNDLAVTYDGTALADVVSGLGAKYTLSGVRGRDLLGMAVTMDQPAGIDGSRFIDAFLPPRDIAVELGLAGSSLMDVRAAERALAGAVHRREPAPLSFADQDGHYDAVLSGVSAADVHPEWMVATLTFTCPSPFLWGDQVTASPVAGELAVQTNYVVEPVITVTPTNAAPAGFTLTVNDAVWTYDGALSAGEAVVIDSAKRETRVGGALKVLEVSGAYPLLRAENEVETSIGTTISVTYRARWI